MFEFDSNEWCHISRISGVLEMQLEMRQTLKSLPSVFFTNEITRPLYLPEETLHLIVSWCILPFVASSLHVFSLLWHPHFEIYYCVLLFGAFSLRDIGCLAFPRKTPCLLRDMHLHHHCYAKTHFEKNLPGDGSHLAAP